MAATLLPPVRGRTRIGVLAAFTASGALTAATAGAAAGLVLGGIPDPGVVAVTVVVAVTLALDLAGPQPPSIRRQVPAEWGRIFAPATTALLYGARLGVGPLTILTSWAWWTGLLLAAVHGPLVGAVGGTAFHLARSASTLAVGARAEALARP